MDVDINNILDKLENGGSKSKIPSTSPDTRHSHKNKANDELMGDEEIFCFQSSPWYVEGGEMRDYQIRGLNWMIQLYQTNINGILADEMGLGKTLQTISMLGYLKHYVTVSDNYDKFLVITPKSTLQNWINEFNKWVPSLNAVALIGDQEERNRIKNEVLVPSEWDVLVTTYEMVIKEKSLIRKFSYRYLAIDEAHRIKNENSKLSEVVRQFSSKNRLLITGTPLQNNLHELWALLNFLMPTLFHSSNDFDALFNLETMEQKNLVQRLHKILKPYLLRRLKVEVEKRLPKKVEIKVYIGLSEMQRNLYTSILSKEIDSFRNNGEGVAKNQLQNILMQLRKCTNHPYLFEGIEPGPPYTTDQHLVNNCGKMVLLDKLLTKLKNQESRVLLFTQMTSMLDIFEDYCRWRGHEYCRLDGQTVHIDRQVSIDEFNAPDSSKFLFMLSTRAGGLGINLTTADIVILYDSDWNPQVDLQAQDRAHRIGQKKAVKVFRLITENTVEERIIQQAEMKLKLDNVVIQQGRCVDKNSTVLQKNTLVEMIKFGAGYLFDTKTDSSLDEDIDELLRKGEEKTQEQQKKLEALDINENTQLSQLKFDTDDSYSVYKFEGENYKAKRLASLGNEPDMTDQRNKRRRVSVNYNFDSLVNSGGDVDTDDPKDPIFKSKYPVKKMPTVYDHQFPSKRLCELIEKGNLYFKKVNGYKVPLIGDDTASKAKRKEEQHKINDAEPFTEEELQEKDKLLAECFVDWNKREFYAFVRGSELAGRLSYSTISSEFVKSKSEEEVKAYSNVFWKRCSEVAEHRRCVKNIEKSEEKVRQKQKSQLKLDEKMTEYKDPIKQIKINYFGNRSRFYSEEEDRYLIVNFWKLGGFSKGNEIYAQLEKMIRADPKFRFNWYFRSRKSVDYKRRCTTLLHFIMREMKDKPQKKKNQPKFNEAVNAEDDVETNKENFNNVQYSEAESGSTIPMIGDI